MIDFENRVYRHVTSGRVRPTYFRNSRSLRIRIPTPVKNHRTAAVGIVRFSVKLAATRRIRESRKYGRVPSFSDYFPIRALHCFATRCPGRHFNRERITAPSRTTTLRPYRTRFHLVSARLIKTLQHAATPITGSLEIAKP